MGKDKNVISGRFTKENARAMQAKGASVRKENSAARKSAREFAEAALNAEVTDKSTGKKIIVKYAIIQKLVAKAVQESDLHAIKYLFELTGESTQKIELTGDLRALVNVEVVSTTVKDEIDKLG